MTTDRFTFSAHKAPTGLVIDARPYFDRVVSSLGDGERFVVTLEPYKEKRSNKQIRAIFGPIYDQIREVILSKEGYRRDEWPRLKDMMHEGLAGKYRGYETCPITKQPVRRFRLSRATKDETTEYMEWLAQMVAEDYGVAIELPGDNA